MPGAGERSTTRFLSNSCSFFNVVLAKLEDLRSKMRSSSLRWEPNMKKTQLLLLAAFLVVSGCQGQGPPGDVDKYMRTHEPKTGGADL